MLSPEAVDELVGRKRFLEEANGSLRGLSVKAGTYCFQMKQGMGLVNSRHSTHVG